MKRSTRDVDSSRHSLIDKIAPRLAAQSTTQIAVRLVKKITEKLQSEVSFARPSRSETSARKQPATPEKSLPGVLKPELKSKKGSSDLAARIAAKLIAYPPGVVRRSATPGGPDVKVVDPRLADCSLSIMVARTDLAFMMHTIPHLVKMCRFPFRERVLFVDTAPLSGDKLKRPDIGSMEQLREACQTLLDRGVVDRVTDIDYNPNLRKALYQKHFGLPLNPTHNWKGYPIYGSLYSLEAIEGEYILHFDSDMMMYQAVDHDWISAAISLIEKRSEVVAVRPLGGPPTQNENQLAKIAYRYDPDGFYGFKFFSSRAYLLSRQRFEQLLPMPVLWKGTRHDWYNALPNGLRTYINHATGTDRLDSWELMVSRQFELGRWLRASLASPQAWTLHPNFRSPEFFAALPFILANIEAGRFPAEQAGEYDLILEPWLAMIDPEEWAEALNRLPASQRGQTWNMKASQPRSAAIPVGLNIDTPRRERTGIL